MSAEIIDLKERRNKRLVRVVRLGRPESFTPHDLAIPAAALVGFVLWAAIAINVVALFAHGKPPD